MASKHYITIPSGKRIGLSNYVKAWRRLKAMDPNQQVAGWDWFETRAGWILEQMRAGIHDRINQRGARI